MPASLRVIIADDHVLFRQGLKSMLVKLHPEVSVVAEVERASPRSKPARAPSSSSDSPSRP